MIGPARPTCCCFPEREPTLHRVPLLEIVDRAGVPLRNRGKGAPLDARLLVRGGLLMLKPQDRNRIVVRIAVKVGELLDSLWPLGNWPKWAPERCPQLAEAARGPVPRP